ARLAGSRREVSAFSLLALERLLHRAGRLVDELARELELLRVAVDARLDGEELFVAEHLPAAGGGDDAVHRALAARDVAHRVAERLAHGCGLAAEDLREARAATAVDGGAGLGG